MNINSPYSFTVTIRASHLRGSISEDEALALIRKALAAEPMISVVSVASARKPKDTPPNPDDLGIRWG